MKEYRELNSKFLNLECLLFILFKEKKSLIVFKVPVEGKHF